MSPKIQRPTSAPSASTVSADFGSGPSPVVNLNLQILLNPRDEISSVTAPLVLSAKATDVSIGIQGRGVFKKKRVLRLHAQNLRAGHNLAAFETSYSGGLDPYASVAWRLALLLHMTSRE